MFKCTQCLSSFGDQSRLQRHINEVHLDLRPFQCPQCEYAAKKKDHLKAHMITHMEREKYKCSHVACFYTSYSKDLFDKHVASHATNTVMETRHKAETALLAFLEQHYTLLPNKFDTLAFDDMFPHVVIDAVFATPRAMVLLECDEKQHKDETRYNVGREVARMKCAGLAVAGKYPDLPILWVRFNPNGYRVNGKRVTAALESRLSQLHAFLDSYEHAGETQADQATRGEQGAYGAAAENVVVVCYGCYVDCSAINLFVPCL